MRQQVNHTVAAAAADNGTHLRVGQCVGQVGQPFFDGTAVGAVLAFAVGTDDGNETAVAECCTGAVD